MYEFYSIIPELLRKWRQNKS